MQIATNGGGNDPGIPQAQAFMGQARGTNGFRASLPTYPMPHGGYELGVYLKGIYNGFNSSDASARIAEGYKNAEQCGHLLYQANGSLLGLNYECLEAVNHVLGKECDEVRDEAYCKGVQMSESLLKYLK